MIAIIDYGVGNVRSVQNMINLAGLKSTITSDPSVLREADRLVMPGVGHFTYAMNCLHKSGLVDVISELVLNNKVPILGICLGSQLMGRRSEEGDTNGLGWIDMDVVAFDKTKLTSGETVPHMCWADTFGVAHPLFAGMPQVPPRFYYVHSFHFNCSDSHQVICYTDHGYRFASGVAVGNIIGLQFHPEKSHAYGRQLFKNWAAMQF